MCRTVGEEMFVVKLSVNILGITMCSSPCTEILGILDVFLSVLNIFNFNVLVYVQICNVCHSQHYFCIKCDVHSVDTIYFLYFFLCE